MNKLPLISIIIPAYNREHLIAETLESIIVQSYNYWECIIIDDGSTDNTTKVVKTFVDVDKRIKLYNRPSSYRAGGNGARNYGLDLVKGHYVVFFDSDDLMTENHLQVKHDLITSGDYDFAITRTKYFNYTNEKIDKYYNFKTTDISKKNYILQKINWLTLDIIVRSSEVKNIRFNEVLKSNQEYNYFSKLVCHTEKGVFKDEVVSLRRHHDASKRTTVAAGNKKYQGAAIAQWYIYLETKDLLDQRLAKELLFRSYKSILSFKSLPNAIHAYSYWFVILKFFKVNFFAKFIYYQINKYGKSVYFLRRLALKK